MQCTATSKRTGERCKKDAVPGKSVCHMHGGKSRAGLSSPRLKHGRYSKHLPIMLKERYEQALTDDDLLNLTDEMGLIDARISALLEQLERGDPAARWAQLRKQYQVVHRSASKADGDAVIAAWQEMGSIIDGGAKEQEIWSELVPLTEQRRKLVETRMKHLQAMNQYITAEQAMLIVATLVGIIRTHVHEPEALQSIQRELDGLLAARNVEAALDSD